VQAAWKYLRSPLTIGGILAGQMYHAINRSDLPYLPDQDPSGVFGDQHLPPLRITVMGDSSVTAPGVDPLEDAWAQRTALHLSDRYRVDLVIVAAGGSRIQDIIDDQLERALATEPDIVWLAMGGNDALRGTPVSRFERQYREVVTVLNDRISVVGCSGIGDLGTIPRLPALTRGVVRVRGRSFDRAIARAIHPFPRTRKTIAWGPQWAGFENDLETFAGDLFHASAKGHRLFADHGTIPVMEELVSLREELRSDPRGSVGSSR